MKNLKNSTKEVYIKPECETINTETEGLICTSGDKVNVSNTKINDYEDGGSYNISVF
ncbi:hypothetical protein I6E11_09835 [Bacteroides caecigallinarum]|uniref:hypothetical protein n=1 Tax=Bacteroides caecigallinarum TaxID=1411144 RepID=UPI001F1AC0C2|nr:hypothetical protein [Bacteroides caecigallinarum]MCF2594077.1 hypothetical protein [Bacteroides caecigallinarum]